MRHKSGGTTYRRANDMWHVKHLKGFTLVSGGENGQKQQDGGGLDQAGDVRVRICLSRCSSRVKDWPQ